MFTWETGPVRKDYMCVCMCVCVVCVCVCVCVWCVVWVYVCVWCVCVHFIKCFHYVMLFIIFGAFCNFIVGVLLSYLKEDRHFF